MRKFLFLMLLICVASFTFGATFTGGIDVYPQYVAGDTTTPFAIHFSASGLATHSDYTVKVRIGTGATGGVWGHTWGGTAGWLTDGSPFAAFTTGECNIVSDASGNASKWVFARCTAVASVVTTNIRLRSPIGVNTDATALAYQSAMNMSSDGGWITGTLSNSSNVVVLAKDAGGNVIGTGITEDNGINEGNASTDGYFKVAVPVGTVSQLEFRNLDNTPHGYSQSGSWTITANTLTDAGSLNSLVPVELSSFSME